MRMKKFAAVAAVTVLAAPLAAGAEGGWELGSLAVTPTVAAGSAAVFHRYMSDVSNLNGQFRNAAGVADAVKRAAAYDPQQLQQGMVVYAAFAALQEQTFIESIKAMEAQYGRDQVLMLLSRDPSGIINLPGAPQAGALAEAALKEQGEAVLASGKSVKQASYDLQRQPWSKTAIANAPRRLAEAKALARSVQPSDADAAQLIKAVSRPQAQGQGWDARVSPVVANSLALAGRIVLGETLDTPQSLALTRDERSGSCLRMAKLNFHQCLSVAGPNYEDVYCVGQHALLDTGTCVVKAAVGG
jgi:hypothetical protein